MSNQRNKSSLGYLAVSLVGLIPAGAVFLLYLYLGIFTRMIADDFCSAYYARRLGLFRSIWYWYLNWSGRYTAFGADWLMEKTGVHALPAIHSLALLAWLFFTVTALQLSLKHVLSHDRVKTVSISLGIIFLFVLLLLDPQIPQTIYWWNGMRSYALPLILLTLYIVFLQIGAEKFRTQRSMMFGPLASFLFMFITSGLGETYIAFQVAFLFYLLVLELLVHRDQRSPTFRLLLTGWIGSLVGFVILVSAPGNAIRQSYFPPHPNIVQLLQISIQSYLEFILNILRSPVKITGLLGTVLSAIYFGTCSERSLKVERWFIPALLLGAFGLSFACFVPGAFATSEPTSARTIIIPVFGLAFFLLWAGFVFGQQLTASGTVPLPVERMLPGVVVLLITYSAVLSFLSLYSTRNIYMDFARKWDQADVQILSAKNSGAESVTIADMNVPTGPSDGDPIDNPKYWVNQCYSLYYGIQVLGPP